MKDKIITFLLMSIIIAILGVIGTLGYIVYTEIMEEGTIQINFEGNTGFPTIEYIPSNNESIDTILNEEMFSGVEDSTNENTTITAGAKTSRYLYDQLDETAKAIYTKLYQNKDNLKTGTYKVEFGNAFQSLLSKDGGDVELKKQYQSEIDNLKSTKYWL